MCCMCLNAMLYLTVREHGIALVMLAWDEGNEEKRLLSIGQFGGQSTEWNCFLRSLSLVLL